MSKEPELGQMIFGNPTGDYGTNDFIDALIDSLLKEIERVYWNLHQKEWNQYADPNIPGVEFQPYWWGDENDPRASKPNLKIGEVEIRWYKYPHRGQSCNVNWNPAQWADWFSRSLEIIRKADIVLY